MARPLGDALPRDGDTAAEEAVAPAAMDIPADDGDAIMGRHHLRERYRGGGKRPVARRGRRDRVAAHNQLRRRAGRRSAARQLYSLQDRAAVVDGQVAGLRGQARIARR